MVKTAIVVLNYNGVDYLRQFLPKTIKFSPECQVVVIDNNSSDDSVGYLENHHPDIQIIKLDQNYGFSGGYNRGLAQVHAENYILLNSDVEVTPGWSEALISYMDDHIQVAACQPKICSLKEKGKFDYAGAAGGFLDSLGYPFCRGRIFNHIEADHGQYDQNQLIFWAGGACFFIKAKVFHELGGLDEEFFAHMEEIDLCWRIQRAGYQVSYVGSSLVLHVGGGTLKDTNPRKTYLNFRNGLQMLVKNSPLMSLVWKLPIRMALDTVAMLRFLILGSLPHLLAVIKAEIWFVLHIGRAWSKRNNLLPYQVELYRGLLIWDYFIRGKKTYNQLFKGEK